MDHLVAVLGAHAQARLEIGDRGRQHEDADEIGAALLAQLLGALPIDVEQHVAARREHALDWRPRRAVAVAEHLGPFEKLALRDHRVETRAIDELIIGALDLARRGAGAS